MGGIGPQGMRDGDGAEPKSAWYRVGKATRGSGTQQSISNPASLKKWGKGKGEREKGKKGKKEKGKKGNGKEKGREREKGRGEGKEKRGTQGCRTHLHPNPLPYPTILSTATVPVFK